MVVVQLRLKPLPSLLQDMLVCVEPAVLFWEILLFVLDIKYLKLPFWCMYVLAGERKSCLNGFFSPPLFSPTVLALQHCLDKQFYKKAFSFAPDAAFLGGSGL